MLEYITIPLSPSGGSSSSGSGGLTQSTADSLYLSKKSNKLTALPLKTPIHQDDILLIEDSQDSNKKKKIKVSDLKTDLDDSEVWKPSIAYSSDNVFSFKTTNTTATFKNGEKIEANKVYLARYDSGATSSATLTNSEMAKFVRINHDDAITAIWDKDKDTGIEFERTSDDDVMHFVQGGDDVMHIQNRRVGINGENPDQTLQVKSIISSRAAISAAVTNDSSTLGTNAPSLEIANLSANVGGYATINFTDGIRVSPSAMIATKITNKTNNYGDLEFWTRGATSGTRISIWASGQINLYENTRFYKGLMDKDGHIGTNGQILVSTGSGVDWIDAKTKRLQDDDNDTTIEVERTTDNDIIYLKTNGADRLIVNKDGKIGLGTIASLAQLEVRTNNNQGIIIQSGNGAGTSARTQLGFGWQETNNYQHRILTEHNSSASSGNKIIFKLWNYGVDTATTLGSLQVLTLVGNGRVGIMTSEPTQRLDVNGNVRLRSGLYDGDNGKGANGQVLSSTGNKTKWVSLYKNITVHNASAIVALKSVNHLGCEAHVESTNNYTINGSDWNDGDEFNIINTMGSTVACNLVVSGFTGAYLRDGSTTNITSLNIGEQDASFLLRITENPLNSGTKYLNVTRLNRFQVFKKELSSYIMVSDDKNIDDKKLVINTSGTAPTYQMKSGGTLQDLSTAVLGNGKIDDDIKSIAIYVNGLKIPRGRYTKDSAEQVTVDLSNVISGNWISKDTEIEIVR